MCAGAHVTTPQQWCHQVPEYTWTSLWIGAKFNSWRVVSSELKSTFVTSEVRKSVNAHLCIEDFYMLKRHCVVRERTFNLRNIHFFHKWIIKLFSEDNKVPRTLVEARKVAGSAKHKQNKTVGKLCCPLESVCLFSLISHSAEKSLFI